jgi:hypothetical protein
MKREVIDALLESWLRSPEQRLGDLIANAVLDRFVASLFYVEDVALAEGVREFVTDKQGGGPG